jgi:hypothetical protein
MSSNKIFVKPNLNDLKLFVEDIKVNENQDEDYTACWNGARYMLSLHGIEGDLDKNVREKYVKLKDISEINFWSGIYHLFLDMEDEHHYFSIFIKDEYLYLYNTYGGCPYFLIKRYDLNKWINNLRLAADGDLSAFLYIFHIPKNFAPKYITDKWSVSYLKITSEIEYDVSIEENEEGDVEIEISEDENDDEFSSLFGKNLQLVYERKNFDMSSKSFEKSSQIGKGDQGTIYRYKDNYGTFYAVKHYFLNQVYELNYLKKLTDDHLYIEKIGYAPILYTSFMTDEGAYMIFELLKNTITKKSIINYKDILIKIYKDLLNDNYILDDFKPNNIMLDKNKKLKLIDISLTHNPTEEEIEESKQVFEYFLGKF